MPVPDLELWGDAARRAAVVALAWLLLANAGIGVWVWRDRRRQRDEPGGRLELPGMEDDEPRPRRLRRPRVELWHRGRAREGSRHG